MGTGLSLIDWLVVILLPVCSCVGAILTARLLTAREIDRVRSGFTTTIQRLTSRIQELERGYDRTAAMPLRPEPRPASLFSRDDAERAPRPSPPLAPQRPMQLVQPMEPPDDDATAIETLTRDAAAALASLDAFRLFARKQEGEGFVLRPDADGYDPVTGQDVVFASDFWTVQVGEARLFFPGYNLRRSQSSLLADSGRVARERLGWLYEIERGEQLAAVKAASEDPNGKFTKGILTLPF